MKNFKRYTLLCLPVFLALVLLLSLTILSTQAEPSAPEISISKSPAVQGIKSGETANFIVTITNTGSVALGNIVVTDTLTPDCNFTMSSLNPGSGSSRECSLANVTAPFTNTVVVSAEDLDSPEVKISNSAEAVVKINAAEILISKSPAIQEIEFGETANFIVTITNTGGVALGNIIITDTLAPDCNFTVSSLDPGSGANRACSLANVTAPFTNTAVVSAEQLGSPEVKISDSAEAVVRIKTTENVAEISISKSPTVQEIQSGETAKFVVTITNTGSVDLGNIVVTDTLAPDCNFTMSSLNSGSGSSRTCSLANVTTPFTNTVVVSAEQLDSPEVKISNSAEAVIRIVNKIFLPFITK